MFLGNNLRRQKNEHTTWNHKGKVSQIISIIDGMTMKTLLRYRYKVKQARTELCQGSPHSLLYSCVAANQEDQLIDRLVVDTTNNKQT